MLYHVYVAHHFRGILEEAEPLIQLSAFMIVVCHVILGFSRRGCYWLFSMTHYIIQTAYFNAVDRTTFPPYFRAILSGFPRDVRSATEKFHIAPKSTIYAVCPKCHATYKPTYDGALPIY